MAVFKFYDTMKKDDSLKLCMTLSNLGDIDEQVCVLWEQVVNFLLQEYCSQCGKRDVSAAATAIKLIRIIYVVILHLVSFIRI